MSDYCEYLYIKDGEVHCDNAWNDIALNPCPFDGDWDECPLRTVRGKYLSEIDE